MNYQTPGFLILFFGILVIANLTQLGCASNRPIKDAAVEDDRIEIGYGSIERSRVAGSVTELESDDIHTQTAVSVADLLRGRVAGVDVSESPNGGISLRIRGSNSLMGNNEPLIVLDGFALHTSGSTLYDINPHDIESITVLKDIASTAIYGIRGANGVIVIKTKKGR